MIWVLRLMVGTLLATQSAVSGSTVSGTVVGPDLRRGIGAAIVTLTRADGAVYSAVSRADGVFRVDGIAPGQYSVAVSKPAHHYVLDRNVSRVDVMAGVPVEGLRLPIGRGAAISGVVTDEKQQPVVGARISAFRLEADGGVVKVERPMVSADDLGHFRFYGLAPGEYLVAAVQPLAAIVGELGLPTTSEIDRIQADLRRGRRRFDTPVAGGTTVTRATGTLFPIYHPGVFDPALATRFRVNYGDELSGADIRTGASVSPATVTGQVIGTVPNFASVAVTMTQEGADFASSSYARIRASAAGTFVLRGVPPGTYTLHARTADYASWARLTFRVEGSDISGVGLVLESSLTLRGHVVVAADSRQNAPALQLARLRVVGLNTFEAAVRRRALQGLGPSILPAAAIVADDGAFLLSGLSAGTYRFQVAGLPSGWRIQRILRGGKELPTGEVAVHNADGGGGPIQIIISR